MTNNRVTLHRVFSANPEKVYRAFSDADSIAAWLPPYGFVCRVISMDFKIGGTELFVTQEGIPDVIPAELCYLGWQESLDKLKRLVEPNIPDA